MAVKYIFVTGGVVSGLGKGITAASLGKLLKLQGLKVTMQKLDPYLNVDPGRMSPYQHGEVYVTDDGAETDLDIGHYERFIDENLTVNSSISSGRIYWSVLSREQAGNYNGGTVQVIPHITNEIKNRIYRLGKSGADVVITEIGGTVGDIESQPFLEAIRQVATEIGKQDVLFVHVSLVVNIPGSDELKSKPTQHSVKELLSLGIQPDIIVCRCENGVTPDIIDKIALFCNVGRDCVVQNRNAETLLEIPLLLNGEGLDRVACSHLGLPYEAPDMAEWCGVVERFKRAERHIEIALVGKYVSLRDAYLSVAESLFHAGIENDVRVDINWVDSELVNDGNASAQLSGADGIIVPSGFGDRGAEGKIAAARYARENGVPFFGISLGLQMAAVEIMRNVLGRGDANSVEFDPESSCRAVDYAPGKAADQKAEMRLGVYPCRIEPVDGITRRAYADQSVIYERHRHRYEISLEYLNDLKSAGFIVTGMSPDGQFPEIMELQGQRFFVGVQFHPEFKSRPNRAHPLFREFIAACL